LPGGIGHLEQSGLLGQSPLTADAVDRSVAGGDHEPGRRVGGRPVPPPALGSDREGVLGGLPGQAEIAEEAAQRGQPPPPPPTNHPPQRTGRRAPPSALPSLPGGVVSVQCYIPTPGRISPAPPRRADGMRAASSSASSRFSASTM